MVMKTRSDDVLSGGAPQIRFVRFSSDGGDYVARHDTVVKTLATMSKRDMVNRAKELWPELFKSGDFTYRGLMSMQAYELAIMLSQI